jgi:hypothetical protein
MAAGLATVSAQTGPAALPPGDPDVGKEYFTGVRPFANAGPSCMACHSVAAIGALGGGALGPDLTGAYAKFGDAGLSSILATTPFPTMRPVFGTRPLLPEEQAALLAFLQQAGVAERSTEAIGQLALLAVAGAAILIGLAHLAWRNRLPGVRRPMLGRAAVTRRTAPGQAPLA